MLEYYRLKTEITAQRTINQILRSKRFFLEIIFSGPELHSKNFKHACATQIKLPVGMPIFYVSKKIKSHPCRVFV
jgi:hypothetical protein